jgi:NADH-quinone oxidoreductase subunit I
MIKTLRFSWEIIRGSLITGRHFVVNMTFHTLKLFGVRTVRRGAVTIQYPEQRKPLPPRHRCLHRLLPRDDGRPRCVACLLCQTVCPAECIVVEASEDPDPEVQKVPSRFTIDLDRCCFCGFCVEACPVDAIRMDTGCIEMAELDRRDLVYELEKLRS